MRLLLSLLEEDLIDLIKCELTVLICNAYIFKL